MARSIWQKTLVASFAWASLGWAQQPASTFTNPVPDAVPATASERIITVQENGKPSHKCKVLTSWQTSDGATAYKVQALDTGETMTIVESGPITSVPGSRAGTRMHAVATRIFHWTHANTPPADAPMPPADVVEKATTTSIQPASAALSSDASPQIPVVSAQPAPTASAITPTEVTEERTGILSRWRNKNRESSSACCSDACACPPGQSVQASQPCTPCVSQAYAPSASQPCSPCVTQPSRAVISRSPYSPVPSNFPVTTSSRDGATTDCCDQKVVVLPALKLDKECNSSLVSVANDCCEPSTVKKDTSAGLLNKWRESWGKADDHRSMMRQGDQGQQPEMSGLSGELKKPDPGEGQLPGKSPQPLGIQSVVGASGGMGGQVQFVPVPIITVPDLTHPPMPPMHAPQPILQQNSAMASASGPASKALGPNMTTTDEGMVNAFTSMPSREQMALATNAFTSEPAGVSAPGAMMAAASQPMLPRSPYAMVSYGAPSMTAPAPVNQTVMATGYQAPNQPGMATAAAQAEQPMLAALRDSLYPSQREWAVAGLAMLDWHVHPEVVQALLSAARTDPAATVRAACVHHLANMQVRTMPVLDTMQKLRADADPRVRLEADQALAAMQPGQLPGMRTAVQPAASWSPNKN